MAQYLILNRETTSAAWAVAYSASVYYEAVAYVDNLLVNSDISADNVHIVSIDKSSGATMRGYLCFLFDGVVNHPTYGDIAAMATRLGATYKALEDSEYERDIPLMKKVKAARDAIAALVTEYDAEGIASVTEYGAYTVG